MSKSPAVLDASALLAFFHRESGADVVEQTIRRHAVFMSAVNYAEVAAKHVTRGKDIIALRNTVTELGIAVIVFDEQSAEAVGQLKSRTTAIGLSLADCACLTLARNLNAIAFTADSAWTHLRDDFKVELIR